MHLNGRSHWLALTSLDVVEREIVPMSVVIYVAGKDGERQQIRRSQWRDTTILATKVISVLLAGFVAAVLLLL